MSITIHKDDRGHLAVLDKISIPFFPKRIFLISEVPPRTLRGMHAHKKCLQFLILLSGELHVSRYDEDGNVNTKILSEPLETYMIDRLTFASQLSGDKITTYLVLASENYDKGDYLHSLSELKQYKML
jgi:UDP-2-acetamido-3-amino-2,3-dideoxy-glucuronate N-acetyltransferase